MTATSVLQRNATGAEIEHFRQYGFVLLKKMIVPDGIARLQVAMDQATATLETSPAHCDLTALSAAAVSFARSKTPCGESSGWPFLPAALGEALRHAGANPLVETTKSEGPRGHTLLDRFVSQRVPGLREFALGGNLPQLAAAFLDLRAVRFFDDVLCVREPGAIDRVAFHQDLSYLHLDGDGGCSFWVFLDPVREGTGAIGYVPGSHRWGHVFKPNFLVSDLPCPDSEGSELPRIDTAPDAFGVQYVEAEPGDIVLHHFLTVHGMQGNRSRKPCRAFALRYVDAALRVRRRPGVAVPPIYGPSFQDGAVLDLKLHPLAWPAAAE